TACKQTVSGSISLPSPGFFSPFPHGTGSLSVAGEYLALEGGPPRFLRGYTCPVVLGYAHQRDQCDFVYRAITCYGGTFQSLRLSPDLVTLRGSPVSAPQPQTRLLGSGLGWSPFARSSLTTNFLWRTSPGYTRESLYSVFKDHGESHSPRLLLLHAWWR